MGRLVLRLAIVTCAVAAAVGPVPAAWIEQFYAAGWYPRAQRALTATSNAVPFALIDVLIVCAVLLAVAGVYSVGRADRGERWRTAARRLTQALAVAGLLYLAFLLCWGLNYRRQPLTARLDFSSDRVTPEAVRALNERAAGEMGRLRRHLPGALSHWPLREDTSRALVPAFDRGVRALGLPGPVRPGRPKTSFLDLYFTRAGVSGMTDPLFLETLVATNVLPVEMPMVVAHEWGHLAGLARESEASFFAWVVCLQGDEAARYSAWLETFLHTLSGLPPAERRTVLQSLPAEVRADLRAMADRTARDEVRFVSLAAWSTYDRYLKANQVVSGVRNYGEVVQLMVGIRFDDQGRPILRRVGSDTSHKSSTGVRDH